MRFTDEMLEDAVTVVGAIMADEPSTIGDCSGRPFLIKVLLHRAFEERAESKDMVRLDSAANAYVNAAIERGLLRRG